MKSPDVIIEWLRAMALYNLIANKKVCQDGKSRGKNVMCTPLKHRVRQLYG